MRRGVDLLSIKYASNYRVNSFKAAGMVAVVTDSKQTLDSKVLVFHQTLLA